MLNIDSYLHYFSRSQTPVWERLWRVLLQRERRATPARLSLNFFTIMKSGRGARSPWRTPDPDIPFKNIIMKSGEEAGTGPSFQRIMHSGNRINLFLSAVES